MTAAFFVLGAAFGFMFAVTLCRIAARTPPEQVLPPPEHPIIGWHVTQAGDEIMSVSIDYNETARKLLESNVI